jgi:hypothetical protein
VYCAQLLVWLLPLAVAGQTRPATAPAISSEAALDIVRSITAPDIDHPPEEGMRASWNTVNYALHSAQAGLYCTHCQGTGITGQMMKKFLHGGHRYIHEVIPGTEEPCKYCQGTGVRVERVANLLNRMAEALIWCPREALSDRRYFLAWEQFDVHLYGQVCEPVLLAVNRQNASWLANAKRGSGIVVYGRSIARIDAGGCTIVVCELPGTNTRCAVFVEGGCKEAVGSLLRVVGLVWGKLPSEAGEFAGLPLIYAAGVNRVELLLLHPQEVKWEPAPKGYKIPMEPPSDE